MVNKEKYDSILVFESPLTIGKDRIYGLVYDSTYNADYIDPNECNREYVEHIVGAKKWIDSGNEINEMKEWVDKSRSLYIDSYGNFVKNYCKQAYKENPIGYFFQEKIKFNCSEEDIDNNFIINERFWNWAIGQMEELVDSDYYEGYKEYEDHKYGYEDSGTIPYKQGLQDTNIGEGDFINSFPRVMENYGFSVDALDSFFCFKYKGVEIVLSAPFNLDDEDTFWWWDTNFEGNWEFVLTSQYSEDSNLYEELVFSPSEGNMDLFVKKVVECVQKADYCDHTREREARQKERNEEWVKAMSEEDLPF